MLNRRRFLMSTAAAGAAGFVATHLTPAFAQDAPQIQIFVPAAPGGGWDQTGRTIDQVLRSEKLISGSQITNVGGAGGTVGLPQFISQWKGKGNSLMVAGMVMVGAIIANKSANNLSEVTPIARLTGEFEALVVPADSPFKTAGDFVAALKADPTKVPVAGGSAGGSDHILFGLIAKTVGVPATNLSYVPFAGGGEAAAAIIGGQVQIGISGFGEFKGQIDSGNMKALAISADAPLKAASSIPTLKSQGVDVTMVNWRLLAAPPGISAGDLAALKDIAKKIHDGKTWKDFAEKNDWFDNFTTEGLLTFVQTETQAITATLTDLGLVK